MRAIQRHFIAWQGWRIGRWPSRGHASIVLRLSLRACGARPSAGWNIRARMALRGKPRDNAGGGFSEGCALRVRVVSPCECRGIPFPPDDEARGPWPTGEMSPSSRGLPCGRAELAPAHWAGRVKGDLVGQAPGQGKVVVFSKRSWDPLTSAFWASPKVGMLLEGTYDPAGRSGFEKMCPHGSLNSCHGPSGRGI